MTAIDEVNIYERAAADAWQRFSGHLSGGLDSLLCVIGEKKLTLEATTAFNNSADRLGYGKPCTFVALRTDAADPQTLSGEDLFRIIESVDPIVLVVADSASAAAVSRSYGAEVAPGKINRVLGRTCIAFRNFQAMLATPENKQRAWAELKRLPKRA